MTNSTTRIIYDPDNFYRTRGNSQPDSTSSSTLVREPHVSQVSASAHSVQSSHVNVVNEAGSSASTRHWASLPGGTRSHPWWDPECGAENLETDSELQV